MNPLPQNRKTEKVVTRGAQQEAINSAIAWSEAENAVAARLRRLARGPEDFEEDPIISTIVVAMNSRRFIGLPGRQATA